MKRLFLLIIFGANIVSAFAQSKDVQKYINQFDVKSYVDIIAQKNPILFWMAIEDNNPRTLKLKKSFKKEDKTLMEVCGYLLENVKAMQVYDPVVSGYDSITKRLTKDLGMPSKIRKYPIRVIADDEFNASMDPIGQMRINRGILRYLTYEELLAVCAHEVAHYFCNHTIDGFWKQEKKVKRNRMWADIGASLMIGAAAASGMYAGAKGADVSGSIQLIENSGIFFEAFMNEADQASLRYYFRYSRDQELEADILAYRFMEFMGYGTEHWISAMRKMLQFGRDYSAKAGKHDDHPTTMFRLQILVALESGYVGK